MLVSRNVMSSGPSLTKHTTSRTLQGITQVRRGLFLRVIVSTKDEYLLLVDLHTSAEAEETEVLIFLLQSRIDFNPSIIDYGVHLDMVRSLYFVAHPSELEHVFLVEASGGAVGRWMTQCPNGLGLLGGDVECFAVSAGLLVVLETTNDIYTPCHIANRMARTSDLQSTLQFESALLFVVPVYGVELLVVVVTSNQVDPAVWGYYTLGKRWQLVLYMQPHGLPAGSALLYIVDIKQLQFCGVRNKEVKEFAASILEVVVRAQCQ